MTIQIGWRHAAPRRRAALRAARGARVLLLALVALPASADDFATQAWTNFTMGWNRSEKVYLELDLEPKVVISGEPQWRNLDVTPAFEYYPNSWVDLTGEATIGSTLQTDDLRTNELTVRAGVRTYLLKHVRDRLRQENKPVGWVSVASLFRVEERNFWYSDKTESQHSFRFRARLESKAPINHADLTADRTFYVLADAEAFVPIGRGVEERFANKYRLRVGLGYRINARQRVDLLYLRDWVRHTIEDTPHATTQALDVRYRVVFP
jgi:hypothetical protein